MATTPRQELVAFNDVLIPRIEGDADPTGVYLKVSNWLDEVLDHDKRITRTGTVYRLWAMCHSHALHAKSEAEREAYRDCREQLQSIWIPDTEGGE